ncbi:MAG: hypothetical protein KTR21_13430 [Rhodobacteraceae bacterium]|nr:hypothetical protein [Paracoccaceae bacterium]
MTRILSLTLAAVAGSATSALAHSGHIAPAGGHAHWEALAALGALALIGASIWIARRS